jgi:hypothetical protein
LITSPNPITLKRTPITCQQHWQPHSAEPQLLHQQLV